MQEEKRASAQANRHTLYLNNGVFLMTGPGLVTHLLLNNKHDQKLPRTKHRPVVRATRPTTWYSILYTSIYYNKYKSKYHCHQKGLLQHILFASYCEPCVLLLLVDGHMHQEQRWNSWRIKFIGKKLDLEQQHRLLQQHRRLPLLRKECEWLDGGMARRPHYRRSA